jgi:hypothetical protein
MGYPLITVPLRLWHAKVTSMLPPKVVHFLEPMLSPVMVRKYRAAMLPGRYWNWSKQSLCLDAIHWTSSEVMLIWVKQLDLEDMKSHRIESLSQRQYGSTFRLIRQQFYVSFSCCLNSMVLNTSSSLISSLCSVVFVLAWRCYSTWTCNNVDTSLCIIVC